MLNYTYSSLGTAGTVQAAAADAVVNDHILTITGAPTFDVRQIEHFTVTTTVAATAGVWTITPTAAATQEFSLAITQNVNGVYKNTTLSLVSAASGETATTICDQWRSQFNANNVNSEFAITASGTATFILTGTAANPIFSVKQVNLNTMTTTGVSPSVTQGTIAVVNGTAGVLGIGTYASLVTLQGIVTVPALVSTQSYTQVRIESRKASVNDPGGNVSTSRDIHTVLINNAATNYAALATRLGEIANGFPAGATTADPEFLSIK